MEVGVQAGLRLPPPCGWVPGRRTPPVGGGGWVGGGGGVGGWGGGGGGWGDGCGLGVGDFVFQIAVHLFNPADLSRIWQQIRGHLEMRRDREPIRQQIAGASAMPGDLEHAGEGNTRWRTGGWFVLSAVPSRCRCVCAVWVRVCSMSSCRGCLHPGSGHGGIGGRRVSLAGAPVWWAPVRGLLCVWGPR